MVKITFSDSEMETIRQHGELCPAIAREAMERAKLNFDDIERINDHYETHRWGSDTDRKYRKSAINKAIHKVAGNPLKFATNVF
jgi:hypothetical protein